MEVMVDFKNTSNPSKAPIIQYSIAELGETVGWGIEIWTLSISVRVHFSPLHSSPKKMLEIPPSGILEKESEEIQEWAEIMTLHNGDLLSMSVSRGSSVIYQRKIIHCKSLYRVLFYLSTCHPKVFCSFRWFHPFSLAAPSLITWKFLSLFNHEPHISLPLNLYLNPLAQTFNSHTLLEKGDAFILRVNIQERSLLVEFLCWVAPTTKNWDPPQMEA